MTPSRAFLTIGELVKIFMLGIVGKAHDATGLGLFSISTKHMRQLPATERRSWKQKRGMLMPTLSHACRMLEPLSIWTGLPSTITSIICGHGTAAAGGKRRASRSCGWVPGPKGGAMLAWDGGANYLYYFSAVGALPARGHACLRPLPYELVLAPLMDRQRLRQLGQTLLIELHRRRLPRHR